MWSFEVLVKEGVLWSLGDGLQALVCGVYIEMVTTLSARPKRLKASPSWL